MRRWLGAIAALVLVIALSVGWAMAVREQVNRDPDGTVEAGSTWMARDGFQATVLSWRVEEALPDLDGEPRAPMGGTRWVVVTLKVVRPSDSPHCLPRLFGRGTESWAFSTIVPATDNPHQCAPGGGEIIVDAVYEVPESKVDDVRGVGYELFKLRQPALLLLPTD